MNKTKALELLSTAPTGNVPARLNKGLTQLQAVTIVRKAVEAGPEELSRLIEKRVWQVVLNRKRPKYDPS